jgi:hypothetical protein
VDGGLPLDADPAWAEVRNIEVHADKEVTPEPF